MRIVSWIVVLGSLAWILVYGLQSGESTVTIPEVPSAQAAGTALAPRGAAGEFNIKRLADSYTDAWNSHDPSMVARHFSPQGQIVINDLDRFEGHEGLEKMAAGFMESFPDLRLKLKQVEKRNQLFVYHWTLTGTHHPTGNPVELNGTETWLLGTDGLILESQGRFDAEVLAQQTGDH